MKNKSVTQEIFTREHYDFAVKRTHPLIDWWGHFISNYTVQDLAASCYYQGLLDAMQLAETRGIPKLTQPVGEYEI